MGAASILTNTWLLPGSPSVDSLTLRERERSGQRGRELSLSSCHEART